MGIPRFAELRRALRLARFPNTSYDACWDSPASSRLCLSAGFVLRPALESGRVWFIVRRSGMRICPFWTITFTGAIFIGSPEGLGPRRREVETRALGLEPKRLYVLRFTWLPLLATV